MQFISGGARVTERTSFGASTAFNEHLPHQAGAYCVCTAVASRFLEVTPLDAVSSPNIPWSVQGWVHNNLHMGTPCGSCLLGEQWEADLVVQAVRRCLSLRMTSEQLSVKSKLQLEALTCLYSMQTNRVMLEQVLICSLTRSCCCCCCCCCVLLAVRKCSLFRLL